MFLLLIIAIHFNHIKDIRMQIVTNNGLPNK